MERKNRKTKSVGNGEGSLYYSEALKCYVHQYFDNNGVRKSIKQKKKETNKQFKDRVAELKVSITNGTYIEKYEILLVNKNMMMELLLIGLMVENYVL